MRALLLRAGRILLSVAFLKGGFNQLIEPGPRAEKAADIGLPRPEVAVRLNGTVMVVGGIALALGVKPRLAAAALAAALVPTTIAGHPYWKLEGEARST